MSLPIKAEALRRTWRFLRRFSLRDSGAVTVEWVVLCAGIVGLAVAVQTTIAGGAQILAQKEAHCMRKIGHLTHNQRLDYHTQLKRAAKRCGRL